MTLVSIWFPGMWPDKVCLHHVCYIIMIVLCVVSLHARPTSKGLNIDKNVLQRFKQTLTNHRLQTFNDFHQVLDDLDNIYSHQDKYSILGRQTRDKRDAVGFAGSDILDTLLSTLLRPGGSGRGSHFRPPFPRGRLSVNATFTMLRNQMQSSG
ncbi:uncharacterized protein LOC125648295 [Ostrea edulis]|uniref:uncharacterized protein LOC125648295 n=1 Tax=Ostrea edulis TaxID=37623 RepID=UPI0020961BC4|nr:uncharacterized protein LOC125648295 [Ostrea edulis]